MELKAVARRRRRAIAVVVTILVALIVVRALFGTVGLGILAGALTTMQVLAVSLLRITGDFRDWRKRRRPITPEDRERRLWEREERRHARARALRVYGSGRSGSPRNG
jgi:hypothetical protein